MRTILWCIPFSAVGLFGCGSSEPPSAPPPPAPAFDTTTDVKGLMNWVLDPSADVIWGAVGTIISMDGRKDFAPRTDEEWSAVRNAAAMVIESGNLLMLPGRARNQDDWPAKARALMEAGREALTAAEVKDPEALFTAGGNVYQACSQCHAKYLIGAQAAEAAANVDK